jgi:hypothetical protein
MDVKIAPPSPCPSLSSAQQPSKIHDDKKNAPFEPK